MTTRRPIIVGNWKMNLGDRQGLDQARRLIAEIGTVPDDVPQLAILPPFTALPYLRDLTAATPSSLEYGAQDISTHDEGAYTGEISGSMLIELGCRYALAGHSERRERQSESNKAINAKIAAALRHGLIPILCVGEELDVREQGLQVEHTIDQIDQALTEVVPSDVASLLIAYEPIWAIGTGHVATPDDAQEVCAAIRSRLAERYGRAVADQTRILYGGSVKSATSANILTQADIDGALVGGASLDPAELAAIWRSARQPAGVDL